MKRMTTAAYGTMYYVQDMEKSVAFYTNLGLTPRFESDSWTEFDLGDGTALCLHGTDGTTPLSKGGILIAKVTGIRETVEKLKKQGFEFMRDVNEVHPGAFAADFKDPSGNVMSLYEETGR